ncbi:MAG: hypothetical protein HGA97_12110 [Chlorobiaceae bacterium]|nr:hypothetical protein [Chlorobiaceae bacterium]
MVNKINDSKSIVPSVLIVSLVLLLCFMSGANVIAAQSFESQSENVVSQQSGTRSGFVRDSVSISGIDARQHNYYNNQYNASRNPISSAVVEKNAAGGGSVPKSHTAKLCISFEDIDDDYATYSYVLCGRIDAYEKYKLLIDEIYENTPHSPALSHWNYNLFIIPCKIGQYGLPDKDKPNYQFALDLLEMLRLETRSDKLNKSGPYIITLYKPIRKEYSGDVADILYLDLSGINPVAYRSFVAEYKSRLLQNKLSGINRLKSFKLDLLTITLFTEECIGFAKVAYGKLLSADPTHKNR